MNKEFRCKVAASPFANVAVDIVIPFYEQYAKVLSLVESILRGTYSNQYKIILVDDGSPNKDFLRDAKGKLIQVPYLQIIHMPEQVGFGAALKAGFEVSNSPYVCFLNSDCLVKHPGWLLNMGETLLHMKSQNVRLVSARSNNPVSDIPELKGEQGSLIEDTVVNEPLPLFCALCHRGLFDRIGGFIKPYPFGYFEDTELFYRMKKYGFKQAVSGKSWIYHEGRATVNAIWEDQNIKRIMLEDNRVRCVNDLRSI